MASAVKAVIFDIDGTLLDSVDLHAQAWVEAFAHFGIETEHAKVRAQIGKGGDQLLPMFVDRIRVKREGEAMEAYRSDLFKRAFLDKVRPFPGVRPLFERIRAEGQTIALASSGKADEVAHYKDLLGIADLVSVTTTSDDAERSKPFPDIFASALAKLAPLNAWQSMVVGDTAYDVQAAAKAGLPTIGVLCGGVSEAELRASGCIAVASDPQDLCDRYAESPLAR
ncbi:MULTISPECIES: HAD family hydrolase [unclassified Methylobacterium]|uniref:HAD family hydrolase n=1 Tax=unclassified Methylobacterium TaxID=2615210 RepID=UPI0006FDE597|nr:MULTISPECIES: HAD family hydrolase [unclassified Methylobacterium]KQO71746.1 HAD family hydrolase [Methylobacterium sp. Leaf87]KQP35058.1 HAD family hydrolase [Methylobacterium sp. Leaf100]